MNWLLLTSITLVVLTEHLSADKVYLWDAKSYYCGDIITDIMKTVCIYKKADDVRTEQSILRQKKPILGIVSACCPLKWIRSGNPEIDGCTVREMLENYCDHPERFPIIGDYVVIKDWTSLERRRPVIRLTTPANIKTTDEHASSTKYIQLPTN